VKQHTTAAQATERQGTDEGLKRKSLLSRKANNMMSKGQESENKGFSSLGTSQSK
jgi:hypothetical protein